ncbi:MAG: Stf0 family sulfotransferase [Trebonia sp.]
MNNLAGKALDRRHDYLVCSTHRSGSSLLCELLRGTGVAGLPREHIMRLRPRGGAFDGVTDQDILELLPPLSDSAIPPDIDLIALAREKATDPNGIFATKLMWPTFTALGERLGLQSGPELLPLLTPSLLCVHIIRPDKTAQAVSYWSALQSGSWVAGQPSQREPVYHFRAIDHLRRLLEEQEAWWSKLFTDAGITPHIVTYDELVADLPGTVRGVLRYVGIDSGDVRIPPPALQRQAGARSTEWIDRYRGDRKVYL